MTQNTARAIAGSPETEAEASDMSDTALNLDAEPLAAAPEEADALQQVRPVPRISVQAFCETQ